MSLFDSIEQVIQICQFMGFSSFSMNENTLKWETNSALKVLSIILLTAISMIFLSALIFNDTFLDPTKSLYAIMLNIFLVLSYVHATISLFERLIKRERQIKLLNLFEELDFLYQQNINMNIDYAKLKRSCHRIVLVWICEIIGFLITGILVSVQFKDNRIISYVLIFSPSFIWSKMSYAYSNMLVVLIRENIDTLNMYLKSVVNGCYVSEMHLNRNINDQKSFFSKRKMNLNTNKISFVIRSYSKIWDASKVVQNTTRWSLPIGLANDVFVLVFNSYWVFLLFILQLHEISLYLYPLISVISNLGNIIFIAHNFNTAIETVGKFKLLFCFYFGFHFAH